MIVNSCNEAFIRVHAVRRELLCERATRKMRPNPYQKFFDKHGIKAGYRSGLGFSEKEKKWYGWSHRAIFGFGVGHTIKKGDIGARGRVGRVAKTLDAAKKFAVAFAREIA